MAASVPDAAGVYIVPAFSGLYAPYWREDARGLICGLTRYAGRAHLCRAALEATAYQTVDVVRAMAQESGIDLAELRVDGGMVRSQPLMQFQADILGTGVVRPAVTETTALGAAYAAGLATGFWSGTDELAAQWHVDTRWTPDMGAEVREGLLAGWRRAVERAFLGKARLGQSPILAHASSSPPPCYPSMSKHKPIQDAQIHNVQTGWTDAFLICRKCSRKLDGGFGPDGELSLRRAMRGALRASGQRGQLGLIEVACLGVCPKRAVTTARASQPGTLLIVPVGTPPERLLEPAASNTELAL